MRLVFLYGQAASGKLTIARELAALTGFALFHNHLIVDAVAALFPFGSERFVQLREELWLRLFGEAAAAGQSLVFTFAPEPSVAVGFPERVQQLIERAGGEVHFVQLTVVAAEQERRLALPSREAFGKLRSVELLRQIREDCVACERAMPAPALTIDTLSIDPARAAAAIAERLHLPRAPA